MKRLVLAAAIVAIGGGGLTLPALAAGATPSLPSLTGESFYGFSSQNSDDPAHPVVLTSSVTPTGACGDPTLTLAYDLTGDASGPYAGTFHETGTATFTRDPSQDYTYTDPNNHDTPTHIDQYGRTSSDRYYYGYKQSGGQGALASTFTITSPTGNVVGQRAQNDFQAGCSQETLDAAASYAYPGYYISTFQIQSTLNSGYGYGSGGWTATITGSDGTTRKAAGDGSLYFSGDAYSNRYSASAQYPDPRFPGNSYSVSYSNTGENVYTSSDFTEREPVTVTASIDKTVAGSGWYTSAPVTVRYTCTGLLAGDTCPAPEVLTDGVTAAHTVTATSSDGRSGSVDVAEIKVDSIAPGVTTTYSPTAGNAANWYKTTVKAHRDCTDATSGVATGTCPADIVFSEGRNAPRTATVADVAGNTTDSTTKSLNIDLTAPVVAFTGGASSYSVTQQVTIGCTASDALSGIATSTCPTLDVPAWSLPLGAHTLNATATDVADNNSTARVAFTTTVNGNDVCTLVNRFSSNAPWASGLCSKVSSITSAPNANAKAGAVNAFSNQLSAKTGKGLTVDQAAVLNRLASAL